MGIKIPKINGISTAIFGISWEYVDDTKKEEVLRELYDMRNKLAKFYYCYEIEDSRNGSIIDGKMEFSEIVIEECKEIAETLFKSRFFILLKQDDRDKIIESFDFIASINLKLDLDEEINEESFIEEINQVIEQLLKLFDIVNVKIEEINKELSK